MRLRARSLPIALVVAAMVAGCSATAVDGRPVTGLADVDQSYFFAGDVAVYGQRVSDDDTSLLAYLRALRRIDVCGLLTGDALARVGQIVSVGTLFAFNECDAELKVSGVSERRFVSVSLEISVPQPSGCDVVVPLSLDRLPGAPPLPTAVHPSVKVELIAATDCELTRRIAGALSSRLTAKPLPPRDAVAAYPARLAERDPCEVLSVLNNVAAWDVRGSGPYRCRFTITRSGGAVGLDVRLQPRADDEPASCSAVGFVDPPMQRKVIGEGYVDTPNVVIRPAVVVEDIAGVDCTAVDEVLIQAAGVYT